MPSTSEEWKAIAKSFEEKWQFNNCVGSLSGKHILIKQPIKDDSRYRNYNGTHSVIVFAIVNANYEFIDICSCTYGCETADGVLRMSNFFEKLVDNDLNLPEYYVLPGTNNSVPYVFVSDGTFEITVDIMKPFCEESREKKQFDYRLYRAQQTAENAFGILADRFRVLNQSIELKVDDVDKIVMASCALHNFLIKKSTKYLTPTIMDYEDIETSTFVPGDWRQTVGLLPLDPTKFEDYAEGCCVRNILMEYFNSTGKVDFQDKMVDVVKP